MNEKHVIIVLRMLEFVVEIEFWIIEKVVKRVQQMQVIVKHVEMEK
jgi:hypothetical protein